MTRNEVLRYLKTLAPVNGELYTFTEIKSFFDVIQRDRKPPYKMLCLVTFPDGEWPCLVEGDGGIDGYSYYIPETRPAADRLWRWACEGGLSDRGGSR